MVSHGLNICQAPKSGWQFLSSVGTWLTTKLDAEVQWAEFETCFEDRSPFCQAEPKKVGSEEFPLFAGSDWTLGAPCFHLFPSFNFSV